MSLTPESSRVSGSGCQQAKAWPSSIGRLQLGPLLVAAVARVAAARCERAAPRQVGQVRGTARYGQKRVCEGLEIFGEPSSRARV